MAAIFLISTIAIAPLSKTMTEKPTFIRRLERNGYYGSVVSVKHLEELGAEIKSLHSQGLLYDPLYREYENPYFSPKLPKSLPKAKSIIIVSIPQPMLRTKFHWKGQVVQVVVPPTYFDGNKVTWRARHELNEAFKPKSYKLVMAVLPLKLLAVKSGLAEYGRNNITYIPQHGSLHRLTAFYSDYDSPVDFWQDKKALPLCAKCRACMKACPTGAIQEDRFLIHVDRCLTYLNEKNSREAFPSWVKASAHNCIVGCMRCQRACPYDKKIINWYLDRGEFTEDETAYLLRGNFEGKMGIRMGKKLKNLGLDLSTFPRNLKVLLDQLVT